jgi:hypothetical protein
VLALVSAWMFMAILTSLFGALFIFLVLHELAYKKKISAINPRFFMRKGSC